MIDDAIRDIRAGRVEQGVLDLNLSWTAHPCPAFAAEIERLAACYDGPALAGQGAKLQVEWERRWGDGQVLGLGPLVDCMEKGSSPKVRARLDRLRSIAPDPRVTRGLLAYASQHPLPRSTSARPVWTAFFRLVSHVGDPRLHAVLDHLEQQSTVSGTGDFEAYLAERVPRCRASLPSMPEPHPALETLRAAVDALVDAPPAVTRDVLQEDVAEMVVQDPSDEDALAVWADLLVQADDPRGTFVNLGLVAEQRPLNRKELRLQADLEKTHRLAWIGAASTVIDTKTAAFRRGLLDAVVLPPGSRSIHLDLPTVRQLAGNPLHLREAGFPALTALGGLFRRAPHSQTGPVGFAAWQAEGPFEARDLPGEWPHIRYLELELRTPSDLEVLARFPNLEAVCLVGNIWDEATPAAVAHLPEVLLCAYGGPRGANDARALERFQNPRLHLLEQDTNFYRSYRREADGIHAVFTSAKKGITTANARKVGVSPLFYGMRLAFLEGLPQLASLTLRTQSRWVPEDREAVRGRLEGQPVTYPPGW